MPSFDVYWSALAVYGTVSFILYVLCIATIIRYRKSDEFSSSFFTLWISLGIADCYQFLHSYFLMRFPLLGVFHDFYKAHDWGFVPSYALIAVCYIYYVQLFGNILFALNRYSALTNIHKHDELWGDQRKIAIAIAIQWFISIPFVIRLTVENKDITYFPLPPDNQSLLLQSSPQEFLINGIVCAIAAFSVLMISAALYITGIIKYIKFNKTMSTGQRRQNRVEIRLMFTAAILFACLTVYTCYQIAAAYFSYTENQSALATVLSQWYLINDVYAMINPWALLLTCAGMRKYLLGMLGLAKPKNTVIPFASVTLNSARKSTWSDHK